MTRRVGWSRRGNPFIFCPERTLIITKAAPIGVQFSHPVIERKTNITSVLDDTTHENLFREPDFAPGTAPEEPAVEPLPVRRRRDIKAGTRRRAAA
jgi:hypothetical protein